MENGITKIDQRVEVVTLFRTIGDNAARVYPAKMKWQNKEIVFSELGLRHPTAKGQRMVHVFDMSDGANDYRLEFDAEMLTWTLVAILEGRG